MTYKTKSKNAILNYFISHSQTSIPASKIINDCSNEASRATVYRIIDSLLNEGQIKKFYNESTHEFEYQYSEEKDFFLMQMHMKCSMCGKIIKLSCKSVKSFVSHLGKEHDFNVNQGLTMIYGVCGSCNIMKGK